MSTTPNVPMDDIHLKKYAANAARGLKPEGVVSCRTLSRAVKVGLKRVSRARETLNLWSTGQSSLPGAVEWLLDNAYLARREGMSAREELKGRKRLRNAGGKSYLRAAADALPYIRRDLAIDGVDTSHLLADPTTGA